MLQVAQLFGFHVLELIVLGHAEKIEPLVHDFLESGIPETLDFEVLASELALLVLVPMVLDLVVLVPIVLVQLALEPNTLDLVALELVALDFVALELVALEALGVVVDLVEMETFY